jgi:hypothetical protein
MRLRNHWFLLGTALFLGCTACAISARRAQATPLQTGLINYWTFKDGSGSVLADTGPGGISTDSGTLHGNPTWLTGGDGKFGGGLQFDGATQYIEMPTGGDMDFATTAVTMSAWVKLDQLPSQVTGSFGGIYDSALDDYVLYLDKGNNELRYKATTQSGTSTASSQHPGISASLLNTSDWVHVMGVFNTETARSEIYFNGQLADFSSQASKDFFTGGTIRTGQAAYIGAQQTSASNSTPKDFFAGKISDLAIWNRPLGLTEAQYLYNGGVGRPVVGPDNPDLTSIPPVVTPVKPSAQPIVYYKFDGNLTNSGTGGAAYNAVLHDAPGKNNALFTSEAPFGQGLDLRENPAPITSLGDTNGDYLSVPYTLPNSGTIAMRYQINLFPVAADPENPPGAYYNYATLWANSSDANDWEAWIYNDSRIAARANRSTPILGASNDDREDPIASAHVAFTWERSTTDPTKMTVNMFVDGKYVDTRVGDWRDPGDTFFIAGGGTTTSHNTLGNGIYDEVRIYDTALTPAEALYLSTNAPEVELPDGDFNGDGHVDAADYVVWRKTLGDPTSYNVWRTNFGKPGSGAGARFDAASVPEPATIWVLLSFVATLAGASHRRYR